MNKRYLALVVLMIVLLASTTGMGQQFLLTNFEQGLQSLQYFITGLDKLIPALKPLDTAADQFRTSLEKDDDVDEALLFLALVEIENGDLQAAKDSFNSYLDRNPEETWVYVFIGDLNYSLGEFDQAFDNYQKALESTEYAKAYYGLGKIYLQQGMTEEAIATLATSIELEPGFSEARVALATEYFKNQQYELALDEFEVAYLQNPRNAKVHYYLWILYTGNGEIDKANHSRDLAIQYDPSYAAIISEYQQ